MMKSGVTYISRTVPSARMDTPQSTRILLLLLLLAPVLVLVLAAGCATTPPSGGTVTPTTTTGATPVTTPVTTEGQLTPTAEPGIDVCSVDSDCVPAQCCHPTSCINKAHKGVCNLLCTQVCQGPIDCGAGHCGCVAGTCRVIPGTIPMTTTPTPPPTGGGYSY
jgi:hypothetical protein